MKDNIFMQKTDFVGFERGGYGSMAEVAERDIVVHNLKIHIKSVFTGQTNLNEALKNIVARRLSEEKTNLSKACQ